MAHAIWSEYLFCHKKLRQLLEIFHIYKNSENFGGRIVAQEIMSGLNQNKNLY
jgi:hypothetical protein